MNRQVAYRFFIGLMWLSLPLTALSYWQVWDQLPPHMATHFNCAGEPNGWMTREASLWFALGLTLFILVVFTTMAYLAQRQQVPDPASWSLLAFAYIVVGFIYRVNNSVLDFNLTGHPVEVAPMLIVVPFVVAIFLVVYLGTRRGPALPDAVLLAEEEHNSRLWAVVFLMPVVVELGMLMKIPLMSVKLAALLPALLFLLCFAFAWNGFQYRFTRAGVEIRTLGFRLRSIPRDQIRQYGVEHWAMWRGYGIRGVGRRRAYVWGNQVVHITTPDGDVYLGHEHPERIVRDLDMLRGLAH